MPERKGETIGAGMIAAEKYAELFLKRPQVVAAYVFGSVALLGDGHDVDMILEVNDPYIAIKFLRDIYYNYRALLVSTQTFRSNPVEAEYDVRAEELLYGTLGFYRNALVYEALQITRDDLREIRFGGKWPEWYTLCNEDRYGEAEEIEEKYFREADLFIMPPLWQDNEYVRGLLPSWSSNRPWAELSFYQIMVLQARKYNPEIQKFGPRVLGTSEQEKILKRAVRIEKAARTKEKKKEKREYSTMGKLRQRLSAIIDENFKGGQPGSREDMARKLTGFDYNEPNEK